MRKKDKFIEESERLIAQAKFDSRNNMKIELSDNDHSLLLEVLDYSLDDANNCLSDIIGGHSSDADDEIKSHIKQIEDLIKKIEGAKL